jgi:hypothetical protein
MDTILTLIVKHWKENYTGLSALQISNEFQLSHEDVLSRLRKLETEGALWLTDAQLGTAYLDTDVPDDHVFHWPPKYKMVDTVIAFPNSAILQVVFKKEGKDFGVI